MNVKCPNCRFKFDIGIHSNECKENECICPRCGKLISINQLKEVQLTADKDVQTPADAIPQGSEVELFFEAKRLIDEGSYEKALGYVSKLLEISPNEILYLNLKELIDKTDEEKRKSKERVEQMYSSAIHHIETNELELAESLINELQEILDKNDIPYAPQDPVNSLESDGVDEIIEDAGKYLKMHKETIEKIIEKWESM